MLKSLPALAVLLITSAHAAVSGQDVLTTLGGSSRYQGAAADYNFATGQNFGPTATTTRTGPENEICGGNLYTFAANTAPITSCGLWAWESRTNFVPNNTMVGVVSPNTQPTGWLFANISGLTTTFSNPAVINGMTVETVTITGTPTATATWLLQYTNQNVSASYGNTYTSSVYLSLSNTTNMTVISNAIFWTTAGGSYLAGLGYGNVLSASPMTQYTISATPAQSTTGYINNTFQFNTTNGNPINTTITIAFPQLELNPNLSATVASATNTASGTGGVNGTAIYTVTGGTCTTQPTLNVTWTAGALAVNSVANAGSCSVLPPSPATLTYASGTATGWTGATVTLTPTDNSAKAFATGPILTSGSAVTRNANQLSATIPSCANPSLLAIGTPYAPVTYPTQQMAAEADDGASHYMQVSRAATTGLANFGISGTTQTIAGAWAQSTSGKIAEFIGGGNMSGRFNGGSPQTTAATLSQASTKLQIGSQGGSLNFNGVLSRVAVACNGASLLNR